MKKSTSRLVFATATCSMLVAMSGCSGTSGDSSGTSQQVRPLSAVEVEAALLSADNLGPGFSVSESTESDDDQFGCLTTVDDLSETAVASSEIEYAANTDFEVPTVSHSVATYETSGQVSDAFKKVVDVLQDCDRIEETDADGTTTKLDVSFDEEKSTPEVDEQVNVAAVGSVDAEGLELPVGAWLSFARIGNSVSAVAYADLDTEAGDSAVDLYAEAGVDRLSAVMDGDSPTGALIEAGVGGDAGSDSSQPASPSDVVEGGGFEPLPFDGGSYTWENGVTMTLSVETVEPWGKTDDFCGDSSCGVANPDDTRFVVKYEVQVPSDFAAPFDPISCPGSLQVTTGNDDEALSGVAGDSYRGMDGNILPGATKFGVEEYYIEKAYADEDFYIESSCGDEDFSGEQAFFTGPIEDLN